MKARGAAYPRAADRLKGMVTESTVNIERKFLPLVEEPSMLHIIMGSNNEWPVAIPPTIAATPCWMSPTHSDKTTRTLPRSERLVNGGLAAFLHDLLAHQLDEHALRHPVNTPGKRDVTTHSLKPVQRWWLERLKQGCLCPADTYTEWT